MTKIGYAYGAIKPETMAWMQGYSLDELYLENSAREKIRPRWKEALSKLKGGDELIIARFSNALRTFDELALLIDLCRMRGVRLISVEDRLDTGETLFGAMGINAVLDVIARFPQEVISLRQSLGEEKLQHVTGSASTKKAARMKRDRKAISLYLAGHSLKVIMEKTGIKHTSLYNILKRNGIGRDRIERKKLTS